MISNILLSTYLAHTRTQYIFVDENGRFLPFERENLYSPCYVYIGVLWAGGWGVVIKMSFKFPNVDQKSFLILKTQPRK